MSEIVYKVIQEVLTDDVNKLKPEAKLIDDLGIQVEDSDYKERNRIAKRILKALS